jgi:predicted nucleic acid-binding protein
MFDEHECDLFISQSDANLQAMSMGIEVMGVLDVFLQARFTMGNA